MFRIRMPGVSYSGPLLPLTPEETGISDALKQHIQTLAGDIGERNIWHHANLEAAANYINQSLSAMGYRVQTQSYSVAGRVVENIEVEILFIDGSPVTVELPNFIDLRIAKTDPGIRGDTASGGSKPATLETGAVIQVPLFLNEGDVVKVDTRSGDYLGRVAASG